MKITGSKLAKINVNGYGHSGKIDYGNDFRPRKNRACKRTMKVMRRKERRAARCEIKDSLFAMEETAEERENRLREEALFMEELNEAMHCYEKLLGEMLEKDLECLMEPYNDESIPDMPYENENFAFYNDCENLEQPYGI